MVMISGRMSGMSTWSVPSESLQLQVLRSRTQSFAERPQLHCQAEATLTNRTSYAPAFSPQPTLNDPLVRINDTYEETTRTLPIQLLSADEALERLRESVHENAEQLYHSFFSSELGGVTTERALMQVPIDDHLVHRGHGVFDTALISNGYAYMLDEHLERFRISAQKAAIPLPVSVKQLKRIILETVAASQKMNGIVRYWLGAGRGNFAISSKDCLGPSFYCLMATMPDGDPTYHPGNDYLRGRRVKLSTVPIKDPYFATLKSVNYLPNALAAMDGEQNGMDCSIFVDENGYIAEGPNMNMVIVTKAGELVVPPFIQSLAGLTLRRIMELIPEQLDDLIIDTGGKLQTVSQRYFDKWEVYDCQEAMLVGSTTYVQPVVHFEGKDIGGGALGSDVGRVALVLRAMLVNDMDPAKGPRRLFSEVPYGILTNMR